MEIFNKKKSRVMAIVKVVHSYSIFFCHPVPKTAERPAKSFFHNFVGFVAWIFCVSYFLCNNLNNRFWNGDKKSKIKPLDMIHPLCVQKTTLPTSHVTSPRFVALCLWIWKLFFSKNLIRCVEVNYDTMYRLDQVSKTLRLK